jgi:hypothetical protein
MKTFSQIRQQKNLNESVLMFAAQPQNQTDTEYDQTNQNEPTPLEKISVSASTNTPQTFRLSDGTTIQITPVEAKNIMYTYEELNDENQGIFESLINNNIETYQIGLNFCEEYLN